jgi:hypothetical protein
MAPQRADTSKSRQSAGGYAGIPLADGAGPIARAARPIPCARSCSTPRDRAPRRRAARHAGASGAWRAEKRPIPRATMRASRDDPDRLIPTDASVFVRELFEGLAVRLVGAIGWEARHVGQVDSQGSEVPAWRARPLPSAQRLEPPAGFTRGWRGEGPVIPHRRGGRKSRGSAPRDAGVSAAIVRSWR